MNNYVYNEGIIDVNKVVDLIPFRSWIWLRTKVKGFNCTIYEWMLQPSLCLDNW